MMLGYQFSCSRREPLGISGTVTQVFTGQIPFLSCNQQCQSTEGNWKVLVPTTDLASSFLHPLLDLWWSK